MFNAPPCFTSSSSNDPSITAMPANYVIFLPLPYGYPRREDREKREREEFVIQIAYFSRLRCERDK